jgi:hypothetical protein
MATRVIVRFFVILYVATFIAMSVFRLTHPPTDGSDTFIIILIYAVGCAIGFAIFVPLGATIYARRLAQARQANGPTRYTLTDDSIDLEEANASSRLAWTAFGGFVENKTAIIIRLRGRAQYLIVPKRCLSEAEQTELVTILRDKLAN